MRLAFASARFLISPLIFSIRLLASGLGLLRAEVEFMASPPPKISFERLTNFRDLPSLATRPKAGIAIFAIPAGGGLILRGF
jgi:hypothetical protein